MQTRTKYKTREIKEQDNDEYLKKRENLITGVSVFFFFLGNVPKNQNLSEYFLFSFLDQMFYNRIFFLLAINKER